METWPQTSTRFQASSHRAITVSNYYQRAIDDGHDLPVRSCSAPYQKLVPLDGDTFESRLGVKLLDETLESLFHGASNATLGRMCLDQHCSFWFQRHGVAFFSRA
jgi:hypothetical protein